MCVLALLVLCLGIGCADAVPKGADHKVEVLDVQRNGKPVDTPAAAAAVAAPAADAVAAGDGDDGQDDTADAGANGGGDDDDDDDDEGQEEDNEDDEEGEGQEGAELLFMPAFFASISMIIVSELGDKTFFIAAIMAMKHSRLTVFLGAVAALALMTVLSVLMGFALPTFLPREYTEVAGTILFLFFGVRLLKDAYDMEPDEPNEELAEVETVTCYFCCCCCCFPSLLSIRIAGFVSLMGRSR
eukprot:TRINITY_DN66068_c7_g1_i1.p1 TRINITY_DN66068_c7_g1~~TRINITY_DN66068_c7_g1_i1.p1  ORF type:complete len:263 (-),score=118.09 TRINITY_DN66068_c7_g1_i1:17-745(-)